MLLKQRLGLLQTFLTGNPRRRAASQPTAHGIGDDAGKHRAACAHDATDEPTIDPADGRHDDGGRHGQNDVTHEQQHTTRPGPHTKAFHPLASAIETQCCVKAPAPDEERDQDGSQQGQDQKQQRTTRRRHPAYQHVARSVARHVMPRMLSHAA